MATKHQPSHLPPSPPPSPPKPRHRHRTKRSDPLCDLDAPLPSPSSSSDESQEAQDSLLTRIILTPLLMTSFLLSLFLINRSDRARRTRPTPRKPSLLSSLFAYLSPTTWLDPEPYQDPDDTTWNRGDAGSGLGEGSHVEPPSVLTPTHNQQPSTRKNEGKKKSRSWHLNKKIRKIAHLEIDDAFALRRHIIVVMIGLLAILVVGMWMGVRWVVGWMGKS